LGGRRMKHVAAHVWVLRDGRWQLLARQSAIKPK
jgi:hypothetical protein